MLHVKKKNVEVALALVDDGADVHARDGKQRTALHIACREGLIDVAMALLRKGADIEALYTCGNKTNRPLSESYNRHYFNLSKALIRCGADCHLEKKSDVPKYVTDLFTSIWLKTPLSIAVYYNNVSSIRDMLQTTDFSVINTKEDVEDGWTALHTAAHFNRVECVEVFLATGYTNKCDVFLSTTSVPSPLHIAASRGHAKMVRALVASHHSNSK